MIPLLFQICLIYKNLLNLQEFAYFTIIIMIVCSIIKNRFHLPLASKILRLSFKEEKPSTKQQKKEPENKQLSCTSQINCSRSSSCR